MPDFLLIDGYTVLIDESKYDLLIKYPWSIHFTGGNCDKPYAYARVNGEVTPMHYAVIERKPGLEVDHKDQNTLNNRESNLRYATHSQNMANSRQRKRASKYRGVNKLPGTRWRARISGGRYGEEIYIGCFKSEEDAARAYDSAAKKRYGEFAVLNFPEGGQ